MNSTVSCLDEESAPEAPQMTNGDDRMINNSLVSGNIKSTKRKTQKGIIYFRTIQPDDRQIIQRLHEQWFPVDYKSDFFDGLCTGRVMSGTSEPLYSCVACYKELSEEEFDEMKERQGHGCIKDRGLSSFLFRRKNHTMPNSYVHFEEHGDCLLWESECLPEFDNLENGNCNPIFDSSAPNIHQLPSAREEQTQYSQTINGEIKDSTMQTSHNEAEREKIISFYDKLNAENKVNKRNSSQHNPGSDVYLNEAGERIVGCLIGSFLNSSNLSAKHESDMRDETAALLIPDPHRHSRMFYIMTVGTVPSFRRSGLGSILVNRVVDMIQTRPECGVLYLHVIIYNKGGVFSCFLSAQNVIHM